MSLSSAMEVERPALDVSLVQRHYIRQIWPQVEPLLEMATAASLGRYEVADLYEKLIGDHGWNLWAIYEPDLTVVAAVTSTFTNYPRMRVLHGQFLGGDRLDEWQDLFCDVFDRWGRDNHCVAVEFSGRLGWAKPLARNGYRPVFTTYQRDLR